MTRAVQTFGEVVDAHQTEVLRYLRRLTSNGAEAEDLFQETFLRALPAFRRLRTGSSHRAWLYRIATNVFLNDRRASRRRKDIPLTVDVPEPRRSETRDDTERAPRCVSSSHFAITASSAGGVRPAQAPRPYLR